MPGGNDQRPPCDPCSWPEGSGPIQGTCNCNPSQYTLTYHEFSPLLDSENANTQTAAPAARPAHLSAAGCLSPPPPRRPPQRRPGETSPREEPNDARSHESHQPQAPYFEENFGMPFRWYTVYFTELGHLFNLQPMVTLMSYLLLFYLSLLPSDLSRSTQDHPSLFPSATVIPRQPFSLYYPRKTSVKPYLILPQRMLQGWLPKALWFPPSITRWNPLTASPAQVQIWTTP
jgi:hypothetical protein